MDDEDRVREKIVLSKRVEGKTLSGQIHTCSTRGKNTTNGKKKKKNLCRFFKVKHVKDMSCVRRLTRVDLVNRLQFRWI